MWDVNQLMPLGIPEPLEPSILTMWDVNLFVKFSVDEIYNIFHINYVGCKSDMILLFEEMLNDILPY